MLGVGLAVTGAELRGTRRAFRPADLFSAAGSAGTVADPFGLTGLFQDALGQVPVTGPGGPVALVHNGDQGCHAVQSASNAFRPVLARHPRSGTRQLLDGSQDLAGWIFTGTGSGDCTIAGGIGAPDGSATASRVSFSGSDQVFRFNGISSLASGAYSGQLHIRGTAGETIRLRIDGVTEFNHVLTGGWDRLTRENSTGTPTSFNLNTWGIATARVVDIWHPQFEEGASATAYQSRASGFDVTEAGQQDLWFLSHDQADDYLEADLPDLGAEATEWWADDGGVTVNGGLTIGAGPRILPDSARLYSYGIINRRLTAGETAALTAYLNGKRGA